MLSSRQPYVGIELPTGQRDDADAQLVVLSAIFVCVCQACRYVRTREVLGSTGTAREFLYHFISPDQL